MPIDPSIALQVRQPQMPDLLGSYAQLLQIQHAKAMQPLQEQALQQQIRLQGEAADSQNQDRLAQVAERQQQVELRGQQQKSQQVVDDLMSKAMVQDPTTGAWTLDRAALTQGMIQGGHGHMVAQMDESLNKVDDHIQKVNSARNLTLAQTIMGIDKAGNTPGALQAGAATLIKNRVIDASHAQPLLDAADQNQSPEAIGKMLQNLGQQLPEYRALIEAEAQKKSTLAKTDAETRKTNAEATNLETYGRPTAPEPPSLQLHPVIGPNGQQVMATFDPKAGKLMANGQDITASSKPIPPASTATAPGAADDAKEIAAAIMRGEQPPVLTGMYRQGPAIRAELAKNGYNLALAQTDWQATQKHVGTLNGAQQTRLRQSVDNAAHSLDVIEDLAKKWDAGGFKLLNKARLETAKQGGLGSAAQTLATQLDSQIADVTSELGNVYMGGNSPTDHALGLAAKNLSADWSRETLTKMIEQARTNLQIRSNSMANTGVAGASAGNPYAGSAGQVAPATAPKVGDKVGRFEIIGVK